MSKVLSKLRSLTWVVSILILFSFLQVHASSTWSTKADMPTGRGGISTAAVNNKIYVFGGSPSIGVLTTVEEYDTTSNTWTTKASMPSGRTATAAATVNGKIYVIGGYDVGGYLNKVEEYDPATNVWTTKASMPTVRGCLGAAVVNGKIYAIGGYSNSGESGKVEEYDPTTNTWTTKSNMPTARHYLGVVAANSKIYAVGGSEATVASIVEEYDPTTNTWTTKTNMPTARFEHSLVSINNIIYSIGGYKDSTYYSLVEKYDASADSWSVDTNMPTPRKGFGTVVVNNYIYAIGGFNGSTGLKTVEASLPSSPAPSLTATLNNNQVTLNWSPVVGAQSYNIKRSLTPGIEVLVTNVTGTSYTDINLNYDTTYYYVISAVNSTGSVGADSNEVSVTPKNTGKRSILEIKMISGAVKEYDLSADEINAFLKWYDDKENSASNIKGYFVINKNNNIKPFLSRKDYIVFSKIESFEIKDYNQ